MTDPLAPLEFDDLQRKEVPVRIGSRQFLLREAMAGDVIAYRNFIVRSTKVDAGKKTASVEGYADSELFLLSRCLVEKTDKGDRLVSQETLRSFPNKVQKTLWNRLEAISAMDDDTVDEILEQRRRLDQRLEQLGHAPSTEDPQQSEVHAETNGKAVEEAVKN